MTRLWLFLGPPSIGELTWVLGPARRGCKRRQRRFHRRRHQVLRLRDPKRADPVDDLPRLHDESIASTFVVTAGTFGGMSLYGYLTKRDLAGVGTSR